MVSHSYVRHHQAGYPWNLSKTSMIIQAPDVHPRGDGWCGFLAHGKKRRFEGKIHGNSSRLSRPGVVRPGKIRKSTGNVGFFDPTVFTKRCNVGITVK